MNVELTSNQLLRVWHGALADGVRAEAPDLSARQMAVLLKVYLDPPPHTVRGLAQDLNISKPAITRALDKLCGLELVRRKKDDADKRSVMVQRTVRGSVYLSEFGDSIARSLQSLAETS